MGFGQESMPSGQFEANVVFFRLGVLAYNLFKYFTQSRLNTARHRYQVQILSWRPYQTAMKIFRHAVHQILKISSDAAALFTALTALPGVGRERRTPTQARETSTQRNRADNDA